MDEPRRTSKEEASVPNCPCPSWIWADTVGVERWYGTSTHLFLPLATYLILDSDLVKCSMVIPGAFFASGYIFIMGNFFLKRRQKLCHYLLIKKKRIAQLIYGKPS
jgi:hypothetical protein